jgi:hypothetical protein
MTCIGTHKFATIGSLELYTPDNLCALLKVFRGEGAKENRIHSMFSTALFLPVY